jgi:hypothetical protein
LATYGNDSERSETHARIRRKIAFDVSEMKMKNSYRGLVVGLLTSLASSAYAVKWNVIATTSEGTVSIAQGSQKHTGHLAYVWIRNVFVTPRHTPDAPAFSMQARWVIDCMLETYRSTSIVVLGAKGETLSTDTTDDTEHDIRPDSVAATVREEVCK